MYRQVTVTIKECYHAITSKKHHNRDIDNHGKITNTYNINLVRQNGSEYINCYRCIIYVAAEILRENILQTIFGFRCFFNQVLLIKCLRNFLHTSINTKTCLEILTRCPSIRIITLLLAKRSNKNLLVINTPSDIPQRYKYTNNMSHLSSLLALVNSELKSREAISAQLHNIILMYCLLRVCT